MIGRAATKQSAFLARPLLAREQRHRRIVLLGIAGLLALGTSPIIGHHLLPQADALLAGRDHLFNVCLVGLHLLLSPVHEGFHVLLLMGLGFALWDRSKASLDSRRVLSAVGGKCLTHSAMFLAAAQKAGISSSDLAIVENLPNPAFTAGWFRPRIFVAESLQRTLKPDELEAVLRHEKAHAQRRDPLRLSALRFLACLLFYIPALRKLAADMADEAEIAADDEAAEQHPLALASAIVKLAGTSSSAAPVGKLGSPALVGFQRDELLERRVRRLVGEEPIVKSHVTRRSLAGAGAALAAACISGVIMAHPLPASTQAMPAGSGHTSHCLHHHGSPLAHIFCLGGLVHGATGRCPHASL